MPPLKLLHKPPRNLSIRLHSPRIVLRLRTACLPKRIPRCNALHDNRAPVRRKRIAPREIRSWVPARYVRVPLHKLLPCRQARRGAYLETLVCPSDGHGRLVRSSEVRR